MQIGIILNNRIDHIVYAGLAKTTCVTTHYNRKVINFNNDTWCIEFYEKA